MKEQKKVKRFRKELEKQLEKFLEPFNTTHKIYLDEKGILLAFSLVSTGENEKFDTNIAYRFSTEDIIRKDISYFIKVSKGIQEIKQELNKLVWEKYLNE